MKQQFKELNYTGQVIYAGIDVHKKQWHVSVGLAHTTLRSFSQAPDPEVLDKYLRSNYPGGHYKCAYEAGYCGYWISEQLEERGISCLVVNPSDIPTTDKERQHKTDRRDSHKLLKALRAQDLESIYKPDKKHQQARALLRDREALVKATRRVKNQIKSKLLFFGISIPTNYTSSRWSGKFVRWLGEQSQAFPLIGTGLNFQLDHLLSLRKLNAEMIGQLRIMSKSECYSESCSLLMSIPGIGLLTAMKYLLEMGPIDRFADLDRHASFIGLIPRTYSSGESERVGGMTKRGNKIVKSALIESAWIAKRYDPVLALKFEQLVVRMKPTKAIVIIAKKLLSRIRFVLKHRKPFEHLT